MFNRFYNMISMLLNVLVHSLHQHFQNNPLTLLMIQSVTFYSITYKYLDKILQSSNFFNKRYCEVRKEKSMAETVVYCIVSTSVV